MIGYMYSHAPFGPPHLRLLLCLRAALLTAGRSWATRRCTTSPCRSTWSSAAWYRSSRPSWAGSSSMNRSPRRRRFAAVRLFPLESSISACTSALTVRGVSFLGVIMITDPMGRTPEGQVIGGGKPLLGRATDDHLPTTLHAKLIGLALCLPDVLSTAGRVSTCRDD